MTERNADPGRRSANAFDGPRPGDPPERKKPEARRKATRSPLLRVPERRWCHLPPTTGADHLYGLDALRIGDPRGWMSGDWHKEGNWHWIAIRDTPYEIAPTSGNEPLLDEVVKVLGPERVVEVREFFAKRDHPDAARYEEIWSSAHERAVVELAWMSLHRLGWINGRIYPLRERCRWLRRGGQHEWCLDAMDKMASRLNGDRRKSWQAWTDEWRYAGSDEEDYYGNPPIWFARAQERMLIQRQVAEEARAGIGSHD